MLRVQLDGIWKERLDTNKKLYSYMCDYYNAGARVQGGREGSNVRTSSRLGDKGLATAANQVSKKSMMCCDSSLSPFIIILRLILNIGSILSFVRCKRKYIRALLAVNNFASRENWRVKEVSNTFVLMKVLLEWTSRCSFD